MTNSSVLPSLLKKEKNFFNMDIGFYPRQTPRGGAAIVIGPKASQPEVF
jgi:hypothetical protein